MPFLGLVETKCSKIKESLIRKISCDDEFQWAAMDAISMSGGLLCVWEKNILNVESMVWGFCWLCVKSFKKDMACSVAIVLVYGPHIAEEKRAFWNELLDLKNSLDTPLIIIGDFNEITYPDKRLGCVTISRLMANFVQSINEMELFDLSLLGCKFTWSRGSPYSRIIKPL